MNSTLIPSTRRTSNEYQYQSAKKPLSTATIITFADTNPVSEDFTGENSVLVSHFRSSPISRKLLRGNVATTVVSVERVLHILDLATEGRFKDSDDLAIDLLARCEKTLLIKAAIKIIAQISIESEDLNLERRAGILIESIGRNQSIDPLARTLYIMKFFQHASSRLIKLSIISALSEIIESSSDRIDEDLPEEQKEKLKFGYFCSKVALQWFSEDEQDACVREEAHLVLSEML